MVVVLGIQWDFVVYKLVESASGMFVEWEGHENQVEAVETEDEIVEKHLESANIEEHVDMSVVVENEDVADEMIRNS